MSKHITEKEKLEHLKKTFPRIGFEGFFYFEICYDACTLVKQARAELEKLHKLRRKDGKLHRLSPKGRDLFGEIPKQESVAIAFAAMCLEACIWDYAACGTSQKKAKDNFQSLNLVGKWVIIPKFLCDSDITQLRMGKTCILDKLRKLRKARNDFVHPKSESLPDNFTDALEATIPKRKKITAEDAFGLIGLLLGELEKVDKTNWWFFQTARYKDSIKKLYESSASCLL